MNRVLAEHFWTCMSRFSRLDCQTMVPPEIVPALKDAYKHCSHEYPYVAYQAAALAAVRRDERQNGADRMFVSQSTSKAFHLAINDISNPNATTCRPLYLYLWTSFLTKIELSHTSNQSPLLGISQLLRSHSHLFHHLIPLMPEMGRSADFGSLITTARGRLLDDRVEGYFPVQNMYSLIDSISLAEINDGEMEEIIIRDCKNLAKDIGRISELVALSEQPNGPPHDDRALLHWVAVAGLHAQTWIHLNIGAPNRQPHNLWLVLLANWAAICYLRSPSPSINRAGVWYMEGVGRKIVQEIHDLFVQQGLDQQGPWRMAMRMPVRALGLTWR